MLVFWSLFSLVRNSVVLAVYLLFSVACFFTVHEHYLRGCSSRSQYKPFLSYLRPFYHKRDIKKVFHTVVLEDHTNAEDIILNFITYEKPVVLSAGEISIGEAVASFEGASLLTIETLPITDARLKTAWDHDLYRIRLKSDSSDFRVSVQ